MKTTKIHIVYKEWIRTGTKQVYRDEIQQFTRAALWLHNLYATWSDLHSSGLRIKNDQVTLGMESGYYSLTSMGPTAGKRRVINE
ncbi:hypothetical protein [Agriterribacter sp.]|uniref:hypothetical protein n=1 Tax=Agriterribacter sp. TaxID=2821509 RepID=UPI002B643D67|nr:hypothetical protein [Agriterribacter sp.]HRO44872.1 hypothetical protein [Agriterribacter sp.]HRQ15610.1 hypothetical protein [Agriterribacter sp.]